MPKVTPHVCRHTFCSNMAKSGMNPKTLQYLMGHSDISVTLNTYTHIGLSLIHIFLHFSIPRKLLPDKKKDPDSLEIPDHQGHSLF